MIKVQLYWAEVELDECREGEVPMVITQQGMGSDCVSTLMGLEHLDALIAALQIRRDQLRIHLIPPDAGLCEFCGAERLQGGEGGCPDDDCEYWEVYWEESASWPARSQTP